MVVGRLHSYREGNFSGAMLNFGREPILYTEVTKWSLFRDEAFQEYFEYTPGVLRAYVKPKHLDALTFTLQPVIEAKRLATFMVKHQNPYNKVGKCWIDWFGVLSLHQKPAFSAAPTHSSRYPKWPSFVARRAWPASTFGEKWRSWTESRRRPLTSAALNRVTTVPIFFTKKDWKSRF